MNRNEDLRPSTGLTRIWSRAAAALLGCASVSLALPTTGPVVEVPTRTSSYEESVQCMPEAVWTEELSLAQQEKSLLLVPLETGADGDAAPDFLPWGADDYRESVICTPSLPFRGWSEESEALIAPESSLAAQERLPFAELPSEEVLEFDWVVTEEQGTF